MTGVDVAIVGLFLIACLYLFTPSEADNHDTREAIEDQREFDHYDEDDDDRKPYDQDEDVWKETGGPC